VTALLEVSNLSAAYGGVRALDHVDLTVGEGEFVVLLGPNGAGKTTTLRTLSGLVRPSSGTIALAGRDITRLAGWRRPGLGLGHVPEGRQTFPEHTVEENLRLGAITHRRDRARISRDLEDMFCLFPQLGERRRQLAGTLSGGEAQMLAVARALMSGPRLLLLDEPSLGLAPLKTALLFRYLGQLHRERGLAVLLVEQEVATALQLADRGYVLERGRVAVSGTADQLRADQRVQAVYLGAAPSR
jgi:branched-chain amino acid transport system ATP-binding protein